MSGAAHSASGRPRVSSRETLAEAAAELFLEQTYAGTTIDEISQRAGVSRATFFNYFGSKSDLLWLEVDESLSEFDGVLENISSDHPVMTAVLEAVLALAGNFGPARLPLAVTQYELMGTNAELESSALSRFLTLVRVLSRSIARRIGEPADALVPRSIATAVIGAAVAAASVWARSGVSRGPLAPVVARAIEPVCRGYQAALDDRAVTG
ncbi:TetR/AcrR family transcriptional regulator [Leifsonia poae]|uniref:TetR/AcrR family transcriptional regulator n=1 Tax=Leifsonia poae TaxID=110933 RepID=UPI001CBEF714|nr:TetR/AcrR family transcriptional regulator [Leifsonia poae]